MVKVTDKKMAEVIKRIRDLRREEARLKKLLKEIDTEYKQLAPMAEALTEELGDRLLETEEAVIRLATVSGESKSYQYKSVVDHILELYPELEDLVNELKGEYHTIKFRKASFSVVESVLFESGLNENVMANAMRAAKRVIVDYFKKFYKYFLKRLSKVDKKLDTINALIDTL